MLLTKLCILSRENASHPETIVEQNPSFYTWAEILEVFYMGTLTLASLITLELFFLVWSIRTRDDHRKERGIVRISTLVLFGLLLATGVYVWSFRYTMLLCMLVIQAVAGAVILVRKREAPYRTRNTILRFIRNCIIIFFALLPAIILPQYEQPIPTGTYEVATAKFTWTDPSRIDDFADSVEYRALTVEFWYPDSTSEKHPLVVFSHGAFGFSGSNYSTFMELASQGYVVASIGHTHQAFYTLDTHGNLTTVDTAFIKKAVEINSTNDTEHEQDIFNTTREWMKLRIDDENFVLDTILAECQKKSADTPFSHINTDKIGLFGHSLGGASSAQIGRERSDIDAVIVLDGTMLGEQIAFENNAVVLNDVPYPIPLLNVYAQDHYTNSKELVGDTYSNFHATQNALEAYETVFRDSGHLNFTDLPLFSPFLANLLGIGTVDTRYCIETMNTVVLEFFNCFLQDAGEPTIAKEY